MRIATTRKDVIWNYIGTAFAMGSNFLLLPFLVYFLTGADLGLWYVYVAIGNLVMLFEFGFNPTFSRNFAFCWGGAKELTKEGCVKSDDEEVSPGLVAHLLSACKMVYSRITLIAGAALVLPGTAYVLFVAHSLDFQTVVVSWAIYAVAVLFNLYYLYYAALLRGIGSIARDNQIKIASRVTQLVVTVVLMFFGFGLIGAAIGFLCNALVYRIFGYLSFWGDKRIKELDLRGIEIDKERKKNLYKTISYNAYKDGVVQIANYASTQASALICSTFLGLEQAGAFSIALQFATGIGNLALARMNSSRPMLQSAYQRGDEDLIRKTLGKCAAVYIVLFLALFVIVLFTAYPLLNVFKPESAFDPSVYCVVCLYMFLFNWHSLFASMLCNMNTIPYVKAYIITSVVGIAVSALFCGVLGLGLWGLVAGLAIPQLVYNNWKWPIETARKLDTKVSTLVVSGFKTLVGKG